MDSKRLFSLLTFALFFGIIIFAGYRIYKEDLEQEKKQQESITKPEEIPDEEPVTISNDNPAPGNEYVILTWVYYKNNYCTTIRLYSNGKLEQNSIPEATVYEENNKTYVNIGNLKDEELTTIKEAITAMSKEEMKRDNLSDGHGISIRLLPTDKILYDAEYFDQNEVNKIYNIISKY